MNEWMINYCSVNNQCDNYIPTNIVCKTIVNRIELSIWNHLGRYRLMILKAYLINRPNGWSGTILTWLSITSLASWFEVSLGRSSIILENCYYLNPLLAWIPTIIDISPLLVIGICQDSQLNLFDSSWIFTSCTSHSVSPPCWRARSSQFLWRIKYEQGNRKPRQRLTKLIGLAN